MGLLSTMARLHRRWFARGEETGCEIDRKRRCLFESMEERRMLSATPIHLGAVYIEEDSGADHHGDTFQVLFEGGAAGTQLKRLVIDGDHGPAGLSFGDMLFDTSKGGLGADEAFGFQVLSSHGIGQVTATVADGDSQLILDFEGFEAGDKLVFQIDVDEVQQYDAAETDLDIINQGLDPIASGVEFQGSQLQGTFTAPHYHDAQGASEFRNVYDGMFAGTNLLVTSGNAAGLSNDDAGGRRDRSTGAMLPLEQQPLPVSIAGSVYVDANNNGQRDPGERGIAGVTVQVIATSASSPQQPVTLTTDANGDYFARDLAPGTYRIVEVEQPLGYFDGLDRAGTVDGVVRGSAVNPGDRIESISLLGGEDGVHYDFGELEPGSIRGRVHLTDREGNCTSETEVLPPVVGATVRLRNAAGNLVAETTTDANGEYAFVGLAPGVYTIEEVTPAGLIDGGDHIGTIGGVPVGQKTQNDVISSILVGSGQHGIDYDFCEHVPSSIAGFVYHDRNDNGLREPGEEAIAATTVLLFNGNGIQVSSAVTDANGFYQFAGLSKGVYRITEQQPGGWLDGRDTAGSINGVKVGAAANPGDAITNVSLLWGDHSIRNNFGELLPGSIAGIVHIDTVRNCLVGPGEAGVEGVTVELLDATGQVIGSTQTDANGRYRFEGLAPGVYAVREIQPAATFHGGQQPGSGGGQETADLLFDIHVGSDQHLFDYNFCELPPAVLSGYVFRDGPVIFTPDGRPPADLHVIRDGKLTTDDLRLAGVVLELRNALTGEAIRGEDMLPGTYGPGPVRAVTNAAGYYEFRGLREGSYAVVQIQPAGYFDSLDTPGASGGIAVNPHAAINPLLLQPFAMAGAKINNDAIIRIPIGFGVTSAENNFSEVQVRTDEIPPPPPPPVTPIPPFTPDPLLAPRPTQVIAPLVLATPGPDLPQVNNFVRLDDYSPSTGSGDYTWHLSVVNGGSPRGTPRSFRDGSSVLRPAKFLEQTQWSSERLHAGQWTLPAASDELRSAGPDGGPTFGIVDATPLVGDFDGDGVSDLAMFLDGEWFIDINGNGRWDPEDLWGKLGAKGDRPVVGDWDGDGKDDIGIFGPQWMRDHVALENELGLPDAENTSRRSEPESQAAESANLQKLRIHKNVPPQEEQATSGLRELQHTQRGARRRDVVDHVFQLGAGSDVPVAGDFNGDGIDTIGIFRGGVWKIDVDGDGKLSESDRAVRFGGKHDVPIVGDFEGDGIDEIGVYRAGKWIIDSNHNGEIDAADKIFELGGSADSPIVGDFNGDGADEPSLYRKAG